LKRRFCHRCEPPPGNRTLTGNSGDGADGCTLNNCTLTRNSGSGAYFCTLNNCIVYFNTEANYDSRLDYCCATPQMTCGIGNLTNAPLFVDMASGNLR